MKIQTKKIKPHRKLMSIAQIITVLLSFINHVLHKEEFESSRDEFESTNWM